MSEPTYKQHKILEFVQNEVTYNVLDDESDPKEEDIWILVRAGYLKNFIPPATVFGWNIRITLKGVEYLKGFEEQDAKSLLKKVMIPIPKTQYGRCVDCDANKICHKQIFDCELDMDHQYAVDFTKLDKHE